MLLIRSKLAKETAKMTCKEIFVTFTIINEIMCPFNLY